MRVVALAVLVAAITAAGAAASAPVNVTWPASGKPLRVLFVGDSITDGGGVTNWRLQFREQIMSWATKKGPIFPIQKGHGGVRAAYWAVRKMPPNIGLAIVELGTNDLYQVPDPTTAQLAAFDSSYKQLVAKIEAGSPAVKFVCLSVWHPVGETQSPVPYDTLIEKDCPGAFVSITSIGQTKDHLASDGFHPNNVGHTLITQRIESVVRLG